MTRTDINKHLAQVFLFVFFEDSQVPLVPTGQVPQNLLRVVIKLESV